MKIFYYFEIIVIGIFFHLTFSYIMFDIFFNFKINYGMTPHSPSLKENEIPSKRVSIIIIDGARMDTLFNLISSGKTPFLQEIIEKRGIYGISHTQAPTETYPCITALFTGHFYDGAISLKHYFKNSFILDSVFNESRYSWAFGRDIKFLQKNAKNLEFVDYPLEEYSHYELNDYEMFYTSTKLFENATLNKTLNNMLNQNKIIFVHHLNYSDRIGHLYGPTSKRLKKHFTKLDKYFRQLEQDFNNFYKDNRTTFLITSDHGMNESHNHGDSDPNITRTPFIAWGAGIKHDEYIDEHINKNGVNNTDLSKIIKYEISQIDIPALISGLLAINFPKNSFGIVPIDILNMSDEIKSKILLGNMRQIYEIYKTENDKKSKSILYRPFNPLKHIEQKINDILNHIKNNDYVSSINKILKLIRTIKEGINYAFNYDKFYLKFTIFFGHIIYLIFILLFVEKRAKNELSDYFFSFHRKKMTYISFGIYFFFIVFLFLKHSPFRYYIYTSFPFYFIWRLLVNEKPLIFNYNIIIYVFIIFLFFSLVRNYNI